MFNIMDNNLAITLHIIISFLSAHILIDDMLTIVVADTPPTDG